MKKLLSFVILMLIVSGSFAQLGGGYTKKQADNKFLSIAEADTTVLKVENGVPATDYFMSSDTTEARLAKKANLYQPALVDPTVTTQAAGDNSTRAASTAFVYENTENSVMRDMKAMGIPIVIIPMGTQFLGQTAGNTLVDGSIPGMLIEVKKNTILTGFKIAIKTQGVFTGDNYNGIAINSISGGVATKIAETPNDENIWKGASNSIVTKDLAAPITLTPGLYTINFIYNNSAQTTAPIIQHFGFCSGITGTSTQGNVKQGTVATAQTALPSSYVITAQSTSVVLYGIWGY